MPNHYFSESKYITKIHAIIFRFGKYNQFELSENGNICMEPSPTTAANNPKIYKKRRKMLPKKKKEKKQIANGPLNWMSDVYVTFLCWLVCVHLGIQEWSLYLWIWDVFNSVCFECCVAFPWWLVNWWVAIIPKLWFIFWQYTT